MPNSIPVVLRKGKALTKNPSRKTDSSLRSEWHFTYHLPKRTAPSRSFFAACEDAPTRHCRTDYGAVEDRNPI